MYLQSLFFIFSLNLKNITILQINANMATFFFEEIS